MNTIRTPEDVARSPVGQFVTRRGRRLYEISNVDSMPPFLMTVVGDSDLWMYLSTSGALTAGRVEPDRCLFPYETDDRLHAAGGLTGPVTMIRLPGGELWRPLDPRPITNERTRWLLRTPVGDAVIMEETDHATGVTFRAEWALSDSHGLIRRCELELGEGTLPIEVEVLDGVLNVMAPNVPLGLQQAASTLVDAYKRVELDTRLGLVVFALEATISDRAEASESLRANVIWWAGLPGAELTVDAEAVRDFERGVAHEPRTLTTGRRGALLCRSRVSLEPGSVVRWALAGDVGLDHAALVRRGDWLGSGVDRLAAIDRDLLDGTERLATLLDQADGAQWSGDESACAAHRSNVLFNAMRGGVPADGYTVGVDDLRGFLESRHRGIARRHEAFVAGLGDTVSLRDLATLAGGAGDPQLVRLAMEYLPLTFGRRHGDPSRPWNRFRIKTRHDDGSRALGYEGNWRDIFQNWEAVCRSYPAMLPGVIAKFVSASTPDGYNPYRISESGIDWETVEPDEPYANIGYWGDHQVVYLLRLLEQLRDTDPGVLEGMLDREVFAYANVPYRIRPFDDLVRDAKKSIRFDAELDERVRERSRSLGSDARLLLDENDEPRLVNLVEKLLVTAMAKVSNLVSGGGVWMNTQRPEWNDANNALAGYGLSMVTLYQLRRFADFCATLLEARGDAPTRLSAAMGEWCDTLLGTLGPTVDALERSPAIDDARRWRILEALGRSAERAHERVAATGLGGSIEVNANRVAEFFRLTRRLCDHSIAGARREDGLYESYRVLHLDAERGTASVEPLQPMLEGQVAILSSGTLDSGEAVRVLDTLFASELYREDQHTFILYPRTDRPAFLDRNRIPEDAVSASPLLRRALGEPAAMLACRDERGVARFHADLCTVHDLESRLTRLGQDPGWRELVASDADGVRAAYERTFRHTRFTGRSGTMHKYEGLGSVYWHMVSKLMLATQECVFEAVDRGEDAGRIETLCDLYRRVRGGLGMHKTPAEFGAVPHEPYSHSPWKRGAQQPGMTGQVKEGVLARLGELGVRLIHGEIRFEPVLFDPAELLTEPTRWRVRGVHEQEFELPAGSMGLTLGATPVVITRGQPAGLTLRLKGGKSVEIAGGSLGPEWTGEVLGRTGAVKRIDARF